MPKITKKAVNKIPSSKPPYIRTTKNSNKEYEEIRCPICMEHPHNAILLICSSHEKGCRPYLCNAPIQSNCLASYRAATSAASRLRCPLCRGHVREERVVEPARRFLDAKERECREGKCGFVGVRRALMWHWWEKHVGDDVAERLVRANIEAIFVPLHDSTSENGGGGVTPRIRRGPRMSVATPSFPAVCL